VEEGAGDRPLCDIRINIVVPTTGRPTLGRSVWSIGRADVGKRDRLVVVRDGKWSNSELVAVLDQAARLPCRLFVDECLDSPEGDCGWRPRQMGVDLHCPDGYVVFLDDDDILTEGAIDLIRYRVWRAQDKMHVFRMMYGSGHHLWDTEGDLRFGYIGGSQIVVPVDWLKNAWQYKRGGDHALIMKIVKDHGEDALLWHKEYVQVIRPKET
jgi:hypothetical protein